LVLGYIRPEYDYISREALVEDIRIDCDVARRSLERDCYRVYLAGDRPGESGRDGSSEDRRPEEETRWVRSF
jgi:riboflavin kinase